jgi:hypothetical protein
MDNTPREQSPEEQRLRAVARANRERTTPLDMSMYFTIEGEPACAFGSYVARADLQDTFVRVGQFFQFKDRPG